MNILQPRDLEILNFIILFGYVKECHLAILCNLSLVQIRRIIRRLEEDGYVKSSKVHENIHPDLIKTDKQLRKEFGIFRVNTRQRVSDLLIDDKIGIELELSEKPRAKLQEIINTYIINDSIKLVCYFLQSASLLNKIYTLAQNNIKFRFYLFEVDENKRFNKFQQYNGNEFINIDKLNLFELPEIAPKRFGSYQF
ncbi:MAG: hypothetical protein K0R49_577 [Burkholderiales bacterium]|nr:hypothetical protein [Burkholderiales bacterium]